MISLRTHNILDYVIGAVLVLCPTLVGFSDILEARNLFLICGFTLIGYSLLTRYRYSIAKIIPLGVHMTLDVAIGIMLIVSPTLLGYRDAISGAAYVTHWAAGLAAVALVMVTTPLNRTPQLTREEEEDTARREQEFGRAA